MLTASDDHFLHRPASGYLLALAVVYRFAVLTLVAIDLVRSPAEPHPPPGGGEPDAVIDLTDDGPDSGEPAQHFGAVVT